MLAAGLHWGPGWCRVPPGPTMPPSSVHEVLEDKQTSRNSPAVRGELRAQRSGGSTHAGRCAEVR